MEVSNEYCTALLPEEQSKAEGILRPGSCQVVPATKITSIENREPCSESARVWARPKVDGRSPVHKNRAREESPGSKGQGSR